MNNIAAASSAHPGLSEQQTRRISPARLLILLSVLLGGMVPFSKNIVVSGLLRRSCRDLACGFAQLAYLVRWNHLHAVLGDVGCKPIPKDRLMEEPEDARVYSRYTG
jgi:hypothetical protein